MLEALMIALLVATGLGIGWGATVLLRNLFRSQR